MEISVPLLYIEKDIECHFYPLDIPLLFQLCSFNTMNLTYALVQMRHMFLDTLFY